MLHQIIKFCLFLIIIPLTWSVRPNALVTNILDDIPDNLNIQPYVNVDSKLYYFGQNKVNWYNAFLICRSLGGMLAHFNNQQELAALSNYLIVNYPLDRWWWLSGSDQHSEGDFYWYSSGQPITYADWSVGQPDNMGGHEDCVHLWFKVKKYQMNDWICNRTAYYICEADKPLTLAVSVF